MHLHGYSYNQLLHMYLTNICVMISFSLFSTVTLETVPLGMELYISEVVAVGYYSSFFFFFFFFFYYYLYYG